MVTPPAHLYIAHVLLGTVPDRVDSQASSHYELLIAAKNGRHESSCAALFSRIEPLSAKITSTNQASTQIHGPEACMHFMPQRNHPFA